MTDGILAPEGGNQDPKASPAALNAPCANLTDDEKIDLAAARILKKFRPAFAKLAK